MKERTRTAWWLYLELNLTRNPWQKITINCIRVNTQKSSARKYPTFGIQLTGFPFCWSAYQQIRKVEQFSVPVPKVSSSIRLVIWSHLIFWIYWIVQVKLYYYFVYSEFKYVHLLGTKDVRSAIEKVGSISKANAEKYEVQKRSYTKRKTTKKNNKRRSGRAGADENSDDEYINEEEEEEEDSDSKKEKKQNKKSNHLFVTHNYRTTPTSTSGFSSSSLDENNFLADNFPISSPTTKLPSNLETEDPTVATVSQIKTKLQFLDKASQLLKEIISQSEKGTEKFVKYTDLFEINLNKQLTLIEEMEKII